MPPRRLIFAAALVLAASVLVGWRVNTDQGDGNLREVHVGRAADEVHVGRIDGDSASRAPHREGIDGSAFPEGVIALTWDDGPDRETVALARYLHSAHITATFFVVGEWIDGVSNEPGIGAHRFETGYRKMPSALATISALGHRIGAHTENHALLTDLSYAEAARQLSDCQEAIDAYVKSDLKMFRAPGGAWDPEVAAATRGELLAGAIGPIRWDVDAKDWDRSLHCRDAPTEECEPSVAPEGGTRVRATVMAKRYLEAIEARKRGIVLLHDRVGAVGGSYALDVARALIPELVKRDYVFAPPVLAFSDLKARPRPPEASDSFTPAGIGQPLRGDLNGDGRADTCVVDVAKREARCALSGANGPRGETVWASLPADVVSAALVDITHDGRADLCVTVESKRDVLCGSAP